MFLRQQSVVRCWDHVCLANLLCTCCTNLGCHQKMIRWSRKACFLVNGVRSILRCCLRHPAFEKCGTPTPAKVILVGCVFFILGRHYCIGLIKEVQSSQNEGTIFFNQPFPAHYNMCNEAGSVPMQQKLLARNKVRSLRHANDPSGHLFMIVPCKNY